MITMPTSRFAHFRMTFVFALLFTAMHFAYQHSKDSLFETLVIDTATVKPSVALINLIAPELKVLPVEHRLVSSKARLSVLNGCEGTEMLFLLIAAVLAFQAPWQKKLLGLAAGVTLIYLLNQARIVALFFSLLEDKALFSAVHGYIGPVVIVLNTAYFYLMSVRWASQSNS